MFLSLNQNISFGLTRAQAEKRHFKNRCRNRMEIDLDSNSIEKLERVLINKIRRRDGICVESKKASSVWILRYWNESKKEHELGIFAYDKKTKHLVTAKTLKPIHYIEYEEEINKLLAKKTNESLGFTGIDYKKLFDLNILCNVTRSAILK